MDVLMQWAEYGYDVMNMFLSPSFSVSVQITFAV